MKNEIKKIIKDSELDDAEVRVLLTELIRELSPYGSQPVDCVEWVDINDVEANDYNPNSVAKKEMELLYRSIKKDGYTQPVVTFYDKERKKYIIVDGFHRSSVLRSRTDISERTNGMLPVVVIEKSVEERYASTIRHNRARGTHSVTSMTSVVFGMKEKGLSDTEVANELGMEDEEIVRLTHIGGFSAMFKDAEYSSSWATYGQIMEKKRYVEDGD